MTVPTTLGALAKTRTRTSTSSEVVAERFPDGILSFQPTPHEPSPAIARVTTASVPSGLSVHRAGVA